MAFTRISSASIFDSQTVAILRRQAELAVTANQLSSGRKITTAADDPLGAGSAVAIDRALAELERYGLNANLLGNRLNQQESLLAQAGDGLQRLRELAIQASNATLTSKDRQSLAEEVREIRSQFFSMANTVDASGRYLFAGAKDDSRPFIDAAGGVQYVGDQVQRRVEVAPELALADAVPGSEVWMRIPTGDGRVLATAGATNNGSGLLGAYSLVDSTAWNGEAFTVQFTSATTYDVLDNTATVVGTGTYTPGSTLQFQGLSLTLEGQPAVGDTFTIEPSPYQDVFTTLDNFIAALETPATTSVERWRQQNLMNVALSNLSAAGDHFIDIRASGGARLSALDDAEQLRAAASLTLKATVSDIRDVNIAEAASKLTQQQTALEAAQLTFNRVSNLSLFNYLR